MLINKLIQKLVSSQLRYNPAFLFAGQTKAEKPKQAKKAPQASSKGKKLPPVKSEAELKKQAQKFQQDRKLAETILASKTKTGSFYRDTIRQVNINKLTQRAYFNDQSLMMMINSATRKDINIIHEAYFNYLGHNTLILNKTVDNLLTKTISLAEKQPDLIQDNIKKVFDIYRNHQYFGYFPHYDTTVKVAKFAAQNGKLPLFISTLSEKLLIKLDAKSVNQLFQITKQWEDFMRLTKLLIFRFNRGLLTDLNKQKMLSYIFKGIRDIQKIKATSQSKQYNKFLESFQTPSIDLALAWLVVKGKQNKAAQILKNIEEKHPRLQSFFDILTKLQGQKEQKKIKEKLKGFLQGTPHQQFLK